MLYIESQARRASDENARGEATKLSVFAENSKDVASFWLGYFSAYVPMLPQAELKQTSKQLTQTLKFVLDAEKQKLITRKHFIELITVATQIQVQATETIRKNGLNQKKVDSFVRDSVNELALDPDFLYKKFFQEQEPQLISKISEKLGLECPICCQEITLSTVCPISCGHNLHLSCFISQFKAQVDVKKLRMKCTEEGCEKDIPLNDIQEYIPKELLDKYYEFSLHNLVDKNHGMNWCPTPGCRAIFEAEANLEEYRCPSCGKEYCLKCRTQSHHGITCQDNKAYLNLPADEQEFIKFAKGAKYKQCPSCKFWVQKNHGCDHMTCRCSYQFCFRCGAQYGTCSCDQADSFYGGDSDNDDDEGSIYS